MRRVSITAVVLVILALAACGQGRQSGKGLYLPKGDIESGKAAFIHLNCVACHSVAGTSGIEMTNVQAPVLVLGGEVNIVKTYGELITSVINPQHVVSKKYLAKFKSSETTAELSSPMPSFNDEMTVAQLIDIVAFLDSTYKKSLPQYDGYGYHRTY